jgi:competence protein ComEC
MSEDVPRCRVAGRILEDAGSLGTLVSAERLSCPGATVAHAGTLVFDGRVGEPGGEVRASGWLVPLRAGGFDGLRRRLGARALFDVSGKMDVRVPSSPPLALAARLRSGLGRSAAALGGDEAPLLSGLAVGDTEGLSRAAEDDLRRSGLAHLVAVSGSNVAIVLGIVLLIASRLSLKTRVAAGLAALVLYVLVTGPDPSVLRAAAMGGITLTALTVGRRAQPLNALLLGLIVILALRPGLASSIGLALSAAATAGIVLFSPLLLERLRSLPRPVALVVSATVAAQAAVAPLLVAAFGRFSLVGPVANLLAAPAVAPATVLGLAAACLGSVSEGLGRLCARLAGPFVWWILWVGHTLGGRSWAALALPAWTAVLLALVVIIWAGAARRSGPAPRDGA